MKNLRYLFLCLFLLGSGCENTPKPPPSPPLPGTTITNNWVEGMILVFPNPPSTNAVALLSAAGFWNPGHDVRYFTIARYDPYNRAHLNALEQAFREKATAKGF